MAVADPVSSSGPPCEDECALITDAVREAGDLALSYFRGTAKQWKKADNSPVSEADVAVDLALKDRLLAARPGYGWLSEETEAVPATAGRTFVVDPIDGTRGFLDGRTSWALSIALVDEGGRPLAAALLRPANDELFTATRHGGAYCNSARLTIHEHPLDGANIAAPAALFSGMNLAARGAKKAVNLASLALRLAYVATGQHNAVLVKMGSNHWDIAAADLIIAEAGGRLTPPGRPPLHYFAGNTRHGPLVAGPPRLAHALAALLPAS